MILMLLPPWIGAEARIFLYIMTKPRLRCSDSYPQLRFQTITNLNSDPYKFEIISIKMASAPNQSYNYRFYYCLLCDKLIRKVIFMHISLCYYVSQFIKEIHLIIHFINSSLFVSPYFITYVQIQYGEWCKRRVRLRGAVIRLFVLWRTKQSLTFFGVIPPMFVFLLAQCRT